MVTWMRDGLFEVVRSVDCFIPECQARRNCRSRCEVLAFSSLRIWLLQDFRAWLPPPASASKTQTALTCSYLRVRLSISDSRWRTRHLRSSSASRAPSSTSWNTHTGGIRKRKSVFIKFLPYLPRIISLCPRYISSSRKRKAAERLRRGFDLVRSMLL